MFHYFFQNKTYELNVWRTLNLIRGIFAILGWLVISLRPATDRLTKNLETADENIIEGVEETPMQTVTRQNGLA